jgi:thymidylate synthase
MKSYLDIVAATLNGEQKHPVRVDSDGNSVMLDTGTVGIFAAIFRHNMADGFPLLTTKKVRLKTVAIELEGFIKGITSKKWYQERGCNIWNEWANPLEVKKEQYRKFTNGEGFAAINCNETNDKELTKEIQASLDDLGPVYGYQWRRFNQAYDENDSGCTETHDQLKDVADKLRNNPYDRRMVVSGWNPQHISRMALPPCHFAWNVVVYNNKLNLVWHQRSCDLMLGVPYNIASYALLLLLLAEHSGLEPGELVGTLNDCHIYNNQIEAANEQLSREPRKLPELDIIGMPGEKLNIFDWTHEQYALFGYDPHPPISFDLTIH